MHSRGSPLQRGDKGFQKGVQAGEHLLEDFRGNLTFFQQLRFANGVSGVHGSAPSAVHLFVSSPQKGFVHNGLAYVNGEKTVELETKREALRQLISRYNVSHPRVFGSVLTGKDTEDSDLDLLVDPAESTTLFTLVALENEAEALLGVPVKVQSDQAALFGILDVEEAANA